jgi:hypothetical protein
MGLFPSGFPAKTLYKPLLFPIRATCATHLIILDVITQTIFGEEYRWLSSSLCSFLHSHNISSLLGLNIFLSTLFPNTPSLRSSLNVSQTQGDSKVVSTTHRPPLPPRKYSQYSFLLAAESTPRPWWGRKNYVNEICQWYPRKSNPRPSGL